jgi:hypothetical protein
LDVTVMNIALPSAQHALRFTTVDRQWVVTAYTLTFGSLLLLGGRLADLLGHKTTFLVGLAGFAVLPGLRVRQRGHAHLGHAVHLGVPGHRPGAGRGVRGVDGPGGPPAAATPGGARPQPRRRLLVAIHRHGRAVRDLLVPDLLPAADAGLLAARDRRRLPADQRWPCCHGQPVHDRAHAQIRPQAAGRIGDASRIGRGGLAGAAGPAHRLCHGRARPAHPGRDRHGHGDRANDQHRHLRRGPPRRGRPPRPSPSARCSAARSAPRC